jgi:trimethylamine:corrinoid methyltransferase-like protein
LDHDEICQTLVDAGAKQGISANVIRIPKELVEENIVLCPREFVFADRNGEGPRVGAISDAVIWSAGQLESELTFSPAQAVLDDEISRTLYLCGLKPLPQTNFAVKSYKEAIFFIPFFVIWTRKLLPIHPGGGAFHHFFHFG